MLTLEEIANLTKEGGKPAETLMNVVALIAGRFKTDVCSAYLLEPDRANLVLAATVGLRPECVGTLRLALHEGTAGLVAEGVRPVAVDQVSKASRVSNSSEKPVRNRIQSFLGAPIIDRGVLQGVLVVQTIEARIYENDEIRMLADAAAEVAPVVSEARTFGAFYRPDTGTFVGARQESPDGAGITRLPASSANWIRCGFAHSITIRFRYCSKCRWPPSNAAPAN